MEVQIIITIVLSAVVLLWASYSIGAITTSYKEQRRVIDILRKLRIEGSLAKMDKYDLFTEIIDRLIKREK